MKYTEPKIEMSVFDAENVVTASGGQGMSAAMTEAFDAAKDKAGASGVVIDLIFE